MNPVPGAQWDTPLLNIGAAKISELCTDLRKDI